MAAKLNQSLIYSDETYPYFDSDFSQVLDSHLEWLKTTPGGIYLEVDTKYLGRYRGNFYGFLLDKGVEAKFHRIVLLANGLTSPYQYKGQFLEVFLPNIDKMSQLLGSYNTGKRKLSLDIPGE